MSKISDEELYLLALGTKIKPPTASFVFNNGGVADIARLVCPVENPETVFMPGDPLLSQAVGYIQIIGDTVRPVGLASQVESGFGQPPDLPRRAVHGL